MELKVILLFSHWLLAVQAIPYSPWLSTQSYGPLYEGVKLLIADTESQANLTWNETEYQLSEALTNMLETHTLLADYEHTITERLPAMLAEVRRSDALQHCFHPHELAIATFDRELLEKRASCKRMIEVSLATLQNGDNSEMKFIRSAAAEIRNVPAACNVTALKRGKMSSDHVGITMCVVGRIGAIDQRLYEAIQNFSDELAAVALNGDGVSLGDHSCGDFEELRQQFDSVYRDIRNCVVSAGI